jgi:hypothetical protein
MAPDVADVRWCRLHCLHGQFSFQLTSVERRVSGWELQASTAVRGRWLRSWML